MAQRREEEARIPELEQLIGLFARLPGMGMRSGRRAVLYLMDHRQELMTPLAHAIGRAAEKVKQCARCGNLDLQDPCALCCDTTRRQDIICVVENVADLWAMERSGVYRGQYFVLGGTLSAFDGKDPEHLRIPLLEEYVRSSSFEEVILATSATVDGQTTAHYIASVLEDVAVRVTRLGQGIPFGGELDYLDSTTLASALQGRR
ncbi:MAG: recombination protein RecR [Alphaproteobacteria bacterium GM7ARS4]|nr:recombination protein RecR [Alphaproteobacteria bacterium GM7ARS4]